jgi:phytoene dehydrogenase-like protein
MAPASGIAALTVILWHMQLFYFSFVDSFHVASRLMKGRSYILEARKIHSRLLLAQENREVDVVIIGSGIAGLSCGALLASQGYDVIVCESHYEIGGCAHEFCYTEDGVSIPSDKVTQNDKVFKFEAGPSLYSGLSLSKSPNPLKHVFQMIGEEPEWITYDLWGAYLPEAPNGYKLSIGADAFKIILEKYGGPTAIEDWEKLTNAMRPLTNGVMSLPSVAIRPDMGSIVTLGVRYTSALFKTIMQGSKLTRPFSDYYDELNIKDAFLKNYLNLLCFLLQVRLH